MTNELEQGRWERFEESDYPEDISSGGMGLAFLL